MKKTLSLFSALLFFFSLYVNFLAGSGRLNGISTGEVSGAYPTLFTPAGITFSIWGIIFLFNIVFVVTQVYLAFKKPQKFSVELSALYIGISFLNIAWLLLWHHLLTGFALIIIILYLLGLMRCYQLSAYRKSDNKINRFVFINFSIYVGWLSVATIANTAVVLTTLGVAPYGITASIFTLIVMIVALLLSGFFIFYERNLWYPLVISWALLGIFMANNKAEVDGASLVKFSSIFLLLALILVLLYSLIRSFRSRAA